MDSRAKNEVRMMRNTRPAGVPELFPFDYKYSGALTEPIPRRLMIFLNACNVGEVNTADKDIPFILSQTTFLRHSALFSFMTIVTLNDTSCEETVATSEVHFLEDHARKSQR